MAGSDVTLAETYIAGTTHIHGFAALTGELTEGAGLNLVRELTNAYDGWAIRVDLPDGRKVGYIPRSINEVPARLMDAGFVLYGVVSGRFYDEGWEKITFYIKMKRE